MSTPMLRYTPQNNANSPKPIAVVILNWNGAEMLRRYLPAVIANTSPILAEIIVCDNGSNDGSLQFLSNDYPQIKTIVLDRNYGFAEGYNRALEKLNNRYTILLNSDVAPAPQWIEPLYAYMQAHPATGACQPKVLSDSDNSKFEYAGACGGFIDRNGYPYCRGRIFNTIESDTGQYDTPIKIFWATGAALMVRTDLYRKVGGLDADFFAHMEEIDLCWRMQLSGYDIAAVPDSKIYHLGGGTLPASNPHKTYLNFRNNLLLLYKNLPESTRKSRLLIRRLYDTLAWTMFILKGDLKNAGAIYKAHRDFRSMKHKYSNIKVTEDLISSFPNIIFSYYILKREKFAQL